MNNKEVKFDWRFEKNWKDFGQFCSRVICWKVILFEWPQSLDFFLYMAVFTFFYYYFFTKKSFISWDSNLKFFLCLKPQTPPTFMIIVNPPVKRFLNKNKVEGCIFLLRKMPNPRASEVSWLTVSWRLYKQMGVKKSFTSIGAMKMGQITIRWIHDSSNFRLMFRQISGSTNLHFNLISGSNLSLTWPDLT